MTDNPMADGSKPANTTEPTPKAAPPRKGPPILPVDAGRAPNDCSGCFSYVLNDFAKNFDKSAKRWELIVYPSLFAFIVLAMYGFFLIYSLTQDIRTMAISIDPKMGVNMGSLSNDIRYLANNVEMMSTHLEYISDNMETMSVDMQNMSDSVESMSSNVNVMTKSVGDMSKNMDAMNTKLNALVPITNNMTSLTQAIHVMTGTMTRMGYDMNNATRPMSFANQFMPW